MVRLKKESEGVVEFFLNLFMPIWLPIKAIKTMVKEIKEDRKKREEKK